jgi:O-antigen/teichoic acid export membrane protein
VIKDSIYTLVTRFFFIIGKIAYSVFINRTLGTSGKGAFELITSVPDTLTRFGTLGFDEANTYYAGREPITIPHLISNSYGLAMRFAVIALILGAAFFLIPANSNIFTEVPRWAGFLALLVIPIAIMDLLLEGILYGENRIWVRNGHEIVRILSMLFYMGILVVVLQWGVQGAIYGYMLINLSIFAFTFVVLRRFHKAMGSGEDRSVAWKCFLFGRFSWGANFASYLFYNVDKWLINWLVQGSPEYVLEQVGLYGTAVNIIVNIWIIPDAIQTALRPKITQKGEPERKKLVPPSLRAVTILVFFAMVLLALIARPALGFLYNKPGATWDFRDAYPPLMLLMPGIFTLSLAKVFATDLFSRGKPYFAMWISIMSLVLNLIFNFIMIPRWGMNGAAIASSLSYTFSFLAFLYFYVRESGERSRDIFLPKKSDFQLLWSFVRTFWDKTAMNSTDGSEGRG